MSKEFKVRAQLLCKTSTEWGKIEDTWVPALGEVCIYTGEIFEQISPDILFKVGDGVHPLVELNWVSAVAADVYAWAKQEHLQWSDMDAVSFVAPLDQHIKDTFEHADTKYQIVKYTEAGSEVNYKWKLQKNSGDGWVDATGVIDATELENRITNLEASRVVKEANPAGDVTKHAFVINDGNKAELQYKVDNATISTISAANNSIILEAASEVEVTDKTQIKITTSGAKYIRNNGVEVADDELVTWGQVKDAKQATHIRGISTTNPLDALAPDFAVTLDTGVVLVPQDGDIVFYGPKEFLYVAKRDFTNGWRDIGDETIYETKADAAAKKAELQANIDTEATTRATADTNLSAAITEGLVAESTARIEADTTLQTNIDNEASTRSDEIARVETKEDAAILVEKNRIDAIISGSIGLEISHLIQTDGEEIILNCNAE